MDPALKNRTISKLKARIAELPPRVKLAAKYVLDNPADFGLDHIRDTARKSGVSTNTLIRLSKLLDFAGYEEFRAPFRHALVSNPQTGETEWTARLEMAGSTGKIQAEAAKNTLSIVQRSLERQSPEQMARVAQMMLGARHVYLTAFRASFSLAHNLHYVGRMVLPSLHLIPSQMNSAMDDLVDAGPEDLLIAIATDPYSRETVEACRFAKQKGLKLVLIADSDMISPDFIADETLVISVISTHHFCCYAGATAVIENLIAILVSLGGEEVSRRIRSYESLRRDNHSYWNPEKTSVFT